MRAGRIAAAALAVVFGINSLALGQARRPGPTPEQILASDPVLVSLPEVFMRIREVLSDPASTVEEAAAVIGKDPKAAETAMAYHMKKSNEQFKRLHRIKKNEI